MSQSADQLASLLPPDVIVYAERLNMPYLGYHFLRETLTSKLLGESESAILYWLGKDLGKQIPIQSAAGLTFPFIRLGLGKLDLIEEREKQYTFLLTHTIYNYMSPERMGRALSLESGIIAGAISRWRARDAHAELEVYPPSSEEKGKVTIKVVL